MEYITNTFEPKRKQIQKFKVSPRDGSTNVQVATTSQRISKCPQRRQKGPSRDKWGIKIELITKSFQSKGKQKQKFKASPRDGGCNGDSCNNEPKNLKRPQHSQKETSRDK
jgi:hypothetical protein